MTADVSQLEAVAAAVAAQGWAVCPDFLPPASVAALALEITAMRQDGRLQAAGIGKGDQHQVNPAVRSDWIHWLTPTALSTAQTTAWTALQELKTILNRRLYLGLREQEGHLTAYPPGGHYAKHLDNFRGGSARVVSCVLYLNAAWSAADGGELQLYAADDEERLLVEVPPRGGTLACFLSREVPHAVKATARERLSLTVWWR